MRWAGDVERMERGDVYTGFWWGNLKERDHLEAQDLDGSIILRWVFRMWVWGHGLDRAGSEYGQVAGTCGYGEEL